MCVREVTRYESILSPSPWNSSAKLGPPLAQRYTPSLSRQLLLIQFQAVPGWRCVSERDDRIRINPLTAALEFVSIIRSSTKVHSFVVERIASLWFSGSSWTKMCVCQRDDRIWINPLTAAMEFVCSVCRTWSSTGTEVHSFVVEAIATSSISGTWNSWKEKCVRERWQDKNQTYHRCPRICLHSSVLHQGTLIPCRDDR